MSLIVEPEMPEAGQRQVKWLRITFAAGAITDALALIPMLVPSLAGLLWGFEPPPAPGSYFFAMGYGASLMAGWTLLLIWAYQRPVERRSVALLTLLVIAGLVATEVILVATGEIEPVRMIPTWILQALLAVLFGYGYFGFGRAAESCS